MTSPLTPLDMWQEPLQHGIGYPVALFVKSLGDDYMYPLCLSVCRDAYSSACCDRLVCYLCVTTWLKTKREDTLIRCPACPFLGLSPSAFIANTVIDRFIRKEPIHCPNQCGSAGLIIGKAEHTIVAHLVDVCPRSCPSGCGEARIPPADSPATWQRSAAEGWCSARRAATSRPPSRHGAGRPTSSTCAALELFSRSRRVVGMSLDVMEAKHPQQWWQVAVTAVDADEDAAMRCR